MLPLDDFDKDKASYSLVIFGGSGNLARRKLFPALWALYRDNRLPKRIRIFTFCRTPMVVKTLRKQVFPYMSLDRVKERKKYKRFWTKVCCLQGKYLKTEHYETLTKAMQKHETPKGHTQPAEGNRIFYLALPPRFFDNVTDYASRLCSSQTGWTRIIVEKPFASDDLSYRCFQTSLSNSFRESQIYLIDHHLSRRVIQNYFLLRFSNHFWGATLNNRHVAAVMISVKSEQPVSALRADYFNQFGIIRDLMSNHMLQMLAMIVMDQPFGSSTDEIRTERLKALRQVLTPSMRDVVIGQYRNTRHPLDPTKCSYTEHGYIPEVSRQPTFALVVLRIDNPRWKGVPFILRAGLALNDTKTEVRIQYKPVECEPFHTQMGEVRNEMVLRTHPTEELFMRVRLKRAGMDLCPEESEVKLNLDEGGPEVASMNAYHHALLDVFKGDQTFFMHTEEQCEMWRIFSPILITIDLLQPWPLFYEYGSRGPLQAYRQAERAGFVFFASDEWHLNEEALEYTLEKSKILVGTHTAFKPERARKTWKCEKSSTEE